MARKGPGSSFRLGDALAEWDALCSKAAIRLSEDELTEFFDAVEQTVNEDRELRRG